jgi:DNA-damage-inducible protein D
MSKQYDPSLFDEIRHVNEYDAFFWYARELMEVLEYQKWQNFVKAIRRAMLACTRSGNDTQDHFTEVSKMVDLGSGSQREVLEYELSRYACYLIVMNGDPHKEVIALGQTYFAVRTRHDEIMEQHRELLDEDTQRLANREELRDRNRALNDAAHKAGVTNYGSFTDYGYLGLYGGERAADIRRRKGIGDKENPMDYAGGEELADNIFRAAQTAAKIKREGITDQEDAEQAHLDIGRKVRKVIEEMGGTMPEDLSTPPESIQKLERRKRRELKPGQEDAPQ